MASPGEHLSLFSLPEHEAHIWLIDLALDDSTLQSLRQTLDPDETARAARFRFPIHRTRFEASHGAMRLILSRYLGQPPAEIRFAVAAEGKPQIAATPLPLRFNLSHSSDKALLGITRSSEIGIDLEAIRDDIDYRSTAERYFAPEEQHELNALAPGLRFLGFFNCWTRKEAYLKARGTGLFGHLADFVVSLTPGTPPRLFFDRTDPAAPDSWSLYEVKSWPGYAAALAVNSKTVAIYGFNFDHCEPL